MNSSESMEEQFVKRLTQIVEDNLSDDRFGIEQLVAELGISRATLHRKVKSTTNKTVSHLIREIRLNKAKELLLKRSGTVSEISYFVGFGSPTYFIKCFREFYGFPPGKLLKGKGKQNNITTKTSKKTGLFLKIVSVFFLLFISAAILYFSLPQNSDAKNSPKKILSANTTALNFYKQGLDLIDVYTGSRKEEHFLEAKQMFERAISHDSTFGDAYAHIANIYLSNIPFSPKTNKGFNYADSGKVYIDLAEKYGVNDAEFLLRMNQVYCQRSADFDKALNLFEERWKGKEKDYNYYHQRGNVAFHARNYYETVYFLTKYLELKPDTVLPVYDRVQKLGIVLSMAGFQKEAQEFAFRGYELTQNKIQYWNRYPTITFECGNFSESLKTFETAYGYNNLGWTVFNKLLEIYLLTGEEKKALKIVPEFENYIQEKYKREIPNLLLGYYNNLNGNTQKAHRYFNEEIKRLENYCTKSKFQQSKPNYAEIAACYSMLNNKESVLHSLEKLYEKTSIPYLVVVKLQQSPMFDNYRNDADFIKIRQKIEKKYFGERKKIKKVLAKSGLQFTFNREENVVATPL